MPVIEFTETFWNLYEELPSQIKKKALKAVRLLGENPRHPSLESKSILGTPGIYEARVDKKYRFSYERLAGDVLRLRVIGNHDEVLKNP
jgi:mRNA-degrading endonuclease RelE of RelBE toxin-antitoxin system